MPRYRYAASAVLDADDNWKIRVDGFPGLVVECTQASVVDAAKAHASNHLHVPADSIEITMSYYRPHARTNWRQSPS